MKAAAVNHAIKPMHCVLDSSVALAWVLPGEATPATEALLTTVW